MSQYTISENTMLDERLQVQQNDLIKINTYSIKRTLVFIAFFDFFIQVLNGFTLVTANANNTVEGTNVNDLHIYGYISFGCAFLILLGIIGINRFHRYISYGYGIYLALNIMSRLLFIVVFKTTLFTLIISFILLAINIWLLKLLCKFTSNIKKLPDSDVQDLKNGWVPTVVYSTVYY